MIDKAQVYRKAAEIIVRDGKCEGQLTDKGVEAKYIRDASVPVCALGACLRAEHELYGTYHNAVDDWEVSAERYIFSVDWTLVGDPGVTAHKIYNVNDYGHTSAEDIALLLKQHAEDIER